MSIEPLSRNMPSVPPSDAESAPSAERSGPAIISLLQQAADAAKRNEDRAKAIAQRLSQDVQALEQRNQVLEARLRELQDRAVRAEQWLLHIYDEIHVQLIEQSPSLIADGSAERRQRAAS